MGKVDIDDPTCMFPAHQVFISSTRVISLSDQQFETRRDGRRRGHLVHNRALHRYRQRLPPNDGPALESRDPTTAAKREESLQVHLFAWKLHHAPERKKQRHPPG